MIENITVEIPNIEEQLCIKYNGKVLKFKDKDCANYVYNLRKLLKECRSPINYALCLNLSEEEKIEFKNLLAKIKQVLGEE